MKRDRYFLLKVFTIAALTLISSCSRNNLNQCQQIFRIAKEIDSSSENIVRNNQDKTNLRSWLEAAKMMNTAADKIQALHINNPELIEHQNRLATIYRIYARSTYNAVRARENKNLQALKSARIDVRQADKMHQESIEVLNSYCLRRR